MRNFNKIIFYIFANIGLFIIGLVIIYMFLEHALLYQLGLPVLIVACGLMVFVTFRLIIFFTTYKPEEERAEDVFTFTEEEKEKILTGNKTQKIIKAKISHLKKGMLVDAKIRITDKKPFIKLSIKRVYETTFKDLTKEEALKEGFSSRNDLLKAYSSEIHKKTKISVLVFKIEE